MQRWVAGPKASRARLIWASRLSPIDQSLARTIHMASYARTLPPEPSALAAADTTSDAHASVPLQQKQVKVPKAHHGPDDNGRKEKACRDRHSTRDHHHDDTNNGDDISAILANIVPSIQSSKKLPNDPEAVRAAAPDDNVDSADQPELHGIYRLIS